jgi:hypothetical protein
MKDRTASFFRACCIAAALFILVGSGSAAAKGADNGNFAAKPRIDSVSLRCHYTGSARDLVRADIKVRHADVARKAGYGRRFLKVKSQIRVKARNGRKLAVIKGSGSLRTGARGRLIDHRYHRYMNRKASRRILNYTGAGGDCDRKLGAKRKLDVRVRISQKLKRVSGETASASVAATSSANAISATENLRTGITSANPPLFRSPILSATGGNSSFGLVIDNFTSLPMPDVAINNVDDRTVSVLLGTGAGSFTPAGGSPIDMGPHPNGPVSVTSEDFNGDGKKDLAVAIDIGRLKVFLGNGNGTFEPAPGSPFPIADEGWSIAAGDLNGDGDTDLAIASYFSDLVSVMLGDGKGGFAQAAGSPIATGKGAISLAIGQFTDFPKSDLVAVNRESNDLSVLLGSGTGQFGPGPDSPVAVSSSPNSVTVGDMNRDGDEDLVVTRQDTGQVSILLGNGSGSFSEAPGSPHPVGANPDSVKVGDLDQDGRLDIVSIGQKANNVNVLLNGGGGNYSPAQGSPFPAGPNPSYVEIADLNDDGKSDLGVASYRGKFAVLFNNG